MSSLRFEEVQVLLAEPATDLRGRLRDALHKEGFQNVIDTGNLSVVVGALRNDAIDLVIGDTKMPEGDLSEVIYDLRHGGIGGNPFTVVIALVSNPTPERIKRVVNSGADDVLIKPFTPQDLTKRVLLLTESRKRFVVTTDYIGPDRRTKPRSGSMEVPLIQVPNPLNMRVFGQFNPEGIARSIETTSKVINEQKIDRHAYQIKWLTDRIAPEELADTDEGTVILPGEVREHIEKLHHVAGDMSRRIRKTRFANLTEMCLTLLDMAKKLHADPTQIDAFDLVCLKKLAVVVENSFQRERDETEGAGDRKEAMPVGQGWKLKG